MPFDPSPKVADLQKRLNAFMDEHIYPNEQRHVDEAEALGPWKVHPIMDELKPKARAAGLWNLFLPVPAQKGINLMNAATGQRRGVHAIKGTAAGRGDGPRQVGL